MNSFETPHMPRPHFTSKYSFFRSIFVPLPKFPHQVQDERATLLPRETNPWHIASSQKAECCNIEEEANKVGIFLHIPN